MAPGAVASTGLTWVKTKDGLGGFAPDYRVNHTLTVTPSEFGNSLLLFGGRTGDGVHSNEVYKLDVGDCKPPRRGHWQWSLQTVLPGPEGLPAGREGHTATIFRNYLVVFGGLSAHGLLNDVDALDLDTMKWTKPSTSGIAPIRRHQHTLCTFGRKVVVFGGFSEYGDTEKDLAVLDMSNWAWTIPEATGQSPCARMSHTATRFGTKMAVYGGYCLPENDEQVKYLSDIHILDTHEWIWTQPQLASAVPNSLSRAGHAAERVQDCLMIVGGQGPNMPEKCDVWLLDTKTWLWSKGQVVPEIPAALSGVIFGHSITLFGSPYSNGTPVDSTTLSKPMLIMWGGEQEVQNQNIYVLEMSEVELEPEKEVYLPEYAYVGNEVKDREQVAVDRNWQILDAEVTVPRRSIIVQWQLWVKRPGTVRLQVYRMCPREGYAVKYRYPFKLIGETVICAQELGLQRILLSDRDQIRVQRGDVIGYRIDTDANLLGEWPHKLQSGKRVDKEGNGSTPSGVIAVEYGRSDTPQDPTAPHSGHLCRSPSAPALEINERLLTCAVLIRFLIRFCFGDYKGIGEVYDFNDGGARNHIGNPISTFRTFSLKAVIIPDKDQSVAVQEEVPDGEREPDLLYIIADPTIKSIPKKALEEMREQRIMENPMGMSSPMGANGGKKKLKEHSSPSALQGISPIKKDVDTSRTKHYEPSLDLTADGTPQRKKKPADTKPSKTMPQANGKAPQQTDGAKAPLKVPVLDGRRLPKTERLPKELEGRDPLVKKPDAGEIPDPTIVDDSLEGPPEQD